MEEGKGEGNGGIVFVIVVNVGLDESRGGEGQWRTMRRRNGTEGRGGGASGPTLVICDLGVISHICRNTFQKYTYIGIFHHLLLALRLVPSLLVGSSGSHE